LTAKPNGQDGQERFSEQLKLSGFSPANQANLLRGRVLICGAGTIAQVVALNLINVGLGSIKIVATELGKLNILKALLQSTIKSPDSSGSGSVLTFELIERYPAGNEERSNELLKDCHIVVDGLNSWSEKLELSDMCMQTRRPLLHAGGGGLRYQLFSMVPGRSACLRCLLAMVDMEDFSRIRKEEGSLYAMDSLVASYLALEAVKIVGKVGASQGNELFKIDGLSGEMEILRGMDPNKDCPDCGVLRN